MKEFEPSTDFVSRVMQNVHAYEHLQEEKPPLFDRVLASRPLRYAMSGGGIFVGIVFTPVICA